MMHYLHFFNSLNEFGIKLIVGGSFSFGVAI
jgi:hypothetical protein